MAELHVNAACSVAEALHEDPELADAEPKERSVALRKVRLLLLHTWLCLTFNCSGRSMSFPQRLLAPCPNFRWRQILTCKIDSAARKRAMAMLLNAQALFWQGGVRRFAMCPLVFEF